MVNESNFIVRLSGRRENSYYIDYSGVYKIIEIAKVAGMEPSRIKEIYQDNGGAYDESLDVYYFSSLEAAKKIILTICSNVNNNKKGRLVFLTESEIEFIRKALIYEGGNTLHISSKVKDAIFKKLNG